MKNKIKRFNEVLEECDRLTDYMFDSVTDTWVLNHVYARDKRIPLYLWSEFSDLIWDNPGLRSA